MPQINGNKALHYHFPTTYDTKPTTNKTTEIEDI